LEEFAEILRCQVQAVGQTLQAIVPDHLSMRESNELFDPEAVNKLLTK
jgi:hypothetical protein